MISSIFGKTKPINFIILLVFLFIFYWSVLFYLLDIDFYNINVGLSLLKIAAVFGSVLLVDFIVKRNKLTGPNTYAVLFFTLLFVLFPESINDANAIFASVFLLLAIRRLLSIKSLKNIKFKIFDASLWICISSIFYEWTLLFILLIFVCIYTYEAKNIRNWFVIVAAVFCFSMILLAFLSLSDNLNFIREHYDFKVNLTEIYALKWWSSLKLLVFTLANFGLAFWTFVQLGTSGVGKIVSMRIIAVCFVIGVIVSLLVMTKDNNAIVLTFFPSIIFIVNYLESIKKTKFLELLLTVAILSPLILFLTKL